MSYNIEEWLSSRPKVIQELAKKFPPGSKWIDTNGVVHWVIAYSETEDPKVQMVGLTKVNPYEDYDRAFAERIYCHENCMTEFRADSDSN